MKALALALLLALAAPAGAEDFESGLGAWSASGLWHRVTTATCVTPHDGSACVYLGRDGACDYADGRVKDDSLSSAPQSLSDPARAFVSFWMLYEVESLNPSCYDQMRLERSSDGSNWSLLQNLSPAADPPGGGPATGYASGGGLGATPLWEYHRVDLSAFLGTTLWLRFRFVSSASQAGNNLCGPPDADLDNYRGVAIDGLSFNEAPPALALTKRVDPAFAAPGDTLTYSLVAVNTDAAAQTLSVWDTLPAGALFVGADNGGSFGAGRVDWSLPGVGAGAALTLSLRVRIPPAAAVPQDWLNSADGASSAGGPVVSSAPALARVRSAGLSLQHSATPSSITSGDRATYNLVVSNFSAVTQSALSLGLQLPSGLVYSGAWPTFSGAQRWDFSLAPGQTRGFSLWGRGFGEDGAVLTVRGTLAQGGGALDSKTAYVTVKKPIEPAITLRAIYPNPAPSDKPGLPQSAFFYFETNVAMPVTADIFTVAGEKVRSLQGSGLAGSQQLEWDLKNAWGQPVASGVYAVRLWSSLPVLPTPEAFGFVAVLQ